MKTGIYWQDPKYAVGVRRRRTSPSCVLDLPLYKLDGAYFMGRSAYGQLCTALGALWTPQGRSFDGDDYITCESNGFPAGNTPRTIELWVKFASFPTGANLSMLLVYGTISNTQGIALYVALMDGKPYFRMSVIGAVSLDGTTELSLDTWYHVVLTHDGTTQRFYLNGAEEGNTATLTVATILDVCRIGSFSPTGHFLDGKIGEVRIDNGAISALEDHRNYLATKWRYQ